jgi:sortase (surface protein transpeptidase)
MSRASWISIALGALLLIGTPLGYYAMQPAQTVGDLDAVTAPSSVSGADDTEPAPEPDTGTRPPDEPVTDEAEDTTETPTEAPAEAPAPAPVATPVALQIPGIDVDAPVVDVGLEDDGAMEVPADVSTVGWYELGVAPGEGGTAVIAGHVDSREQGPGAFWDIRTLDVDDVVTVDHEDGTSSAWRVVARTSYPKDELPISDIFTRFGPSRLVLITCDGEFDRGARSYSDNVVVYTVPVDTDDAVA